VTDEAGAFVLFPPTDGEYLVRAVPPEGPKGSGLAAAESAPFPVVPSLGVDDVVVRPEPGGSLVVHVVPAPGEDVAGVIVGVTDGGGDRRTARTDEGGSVRFGGLRPGRWIVRRSECELSAGGGTTMSSAFGGGVAPEIAWSCDVRSGETTEHELRLD
jgi:hypothetical protein